MMSLVSVAAVAQLGGVFQDASRSSSEVVLEAVDDGPKVGAAGGVLAGASDCSPGAHASFSYGTAPIALMANVWNPSAAQGAVSVCVHPGVSRTSAKPTDPWTLSWSVLGVSENVVAYPEAMIGVSPWYGDVDGRPTGSAYRPLSLAYRYTLTERTGRSNIAAEVWLTDTPDGGPLSIREEVMVWLDAKGMTPAGTRIASNVVVGGLRYDLWFAPGFGDSSGGSQAQWDYFAFVAKTPSREGRLDIQAFLVELHRRGKVPPDRFLSSVEFGAEVVDGTGRVAIKRFSVSGL